MSRPSSELASKCSVNEENRPETTSFLKQVFMYSLNLFRSFECEVDVRKENIVAILTFAATIACSICYVGFIEPATGLLFENRSLQYKIQGYFMQIVEALVDLVYARSFEYVVHGDDHINPERLAVVLSNHQGYLDYLTIINYSKRCGIDNSNFFFVWKHCVRLPSLQVLYNSWRKRSNWRVPQIALSDVFCPVLESPWRDLGGKWVVIFPEVTPWTTTAMLEHRAECSANGCPKLQNLLYPRYNAFVQTVQFLKEYPLADVYDLTIMYVNKRSGQKVEIPSWKSVLFSKKDWVVHVHVKKTNALTLSRKEKQLIKWLEKQWYQKDELITKFKNQLNTEK